MYAEVCIDMPSIKGDTGEILTAKYFRDVCKYDVLRNVYIFQDTKFAEIDMICISKQGIFVIENKNYSGHVFGSVSDKYWYVRYNGFCTKLYNPIRQNEVHLQLIKTLLKSKGISDKYIFGFVIFNNTVLSLKGCKGIVYRLEDFDVYRYADEVLNSETVKEVKSIIRPLSNQSDEMKLLHKYLLGVV